MLGSEYESYQEFKNACMSNRQSLHAEYVLGKVYTADQLRTIATEAELDLSELMSEANLNQRQGVGVTYNIATLISQAVGGAELGERLARLDHSLFFPFVTYFRFPDSQNYESLDALVTYLRRAHDSVFGSDFAWEFNGLLEPPGRACRLESTLIDREANELSLLFSCTRILVIPDAPYRSVEYYFLARIPVVMRLLFDCGLIEVSMPFFAEAPKAVPDESSRTPERYQRTVRNARAASVQYLPDAPTAFSFRKFTLYLEQELGAKDMGWEIEPQHQAAFDLHGLIPLKEVLDNFSEGLQAECARRGIESHPLADVDLYATFRAIKERSYTYLLVLQAALGPRGGQYNVSTLYGPENSDYTPILWVQGNSRQVAESLREAAANSQTAEIGNPYDLDSLFQ